MNTDVERTRPATLSEALGFSETVVEVGLTHPGVRRVLGAAGGTVDFLVSLDDERITELEVEIGLGHRGFEKEVESIPWHRALPYVARLGLASGLMAETGYCLALEELAGVALPDRAIWLRTLASELARVADHFSRLAAVAAAIGLPSAEGLAQQGGWTATRLLESLTGAGVFAGWVGLGGVARALPEDFEPNWQKSRAEIEATVARFDAIAVQNPSCQTRLRDVAPLSANDCLAWGVTGPSIRAAGMAIDVRRDAPYLAYGSLDFDIPIGENGDDFDRLLIVVEEVRQSLRIVDQCQDRLADLGPGAIRLAEPGWCEPCENDPAAHSASVLEGPSIPPGEVATSIESSTGELAFFLVSDGGPLPRRIHCRGASFFHAQAMPEMLRGAQLDDLLPTAAILHLVSGECDR
jgi:NADH-quinone oxidoreductase subunit D